ncbi:MAG: 5'-methylthioadenosine/adenosylhomocysteine nucleosidase [Phycisphaerales bacterium]|nr:5'-methylthioadenosine/adenosylhomocysteine nucleosidase [Phycisphaerales bacterium]
MILVLAAMDAELRSLLEHLESAAPGEGTPPAALGTLGVHPVAVALTGIGKVAAASCAATLIERYRPRAVLFAGLAGSLSPGLRIGDIIVASRFIQHDLDASPLFPRFQVPLTGLAWFMADPAWSERLRAAAARAVADLDPDARAALEAIGVGTPEVRPGDVATGDVFVSSAPARERVRSLVPEADCVEMEGAAIAQVCHARGVPFAACRVISDSADESAPADFEAFVTRVESRLTAAVLLGALSERS